MAKSRAIMDSFRSINSVVVIIGRTLGYEVLLQFVVPFILRSLDAVM